MFWYYSFCHYLNVAANVLLFDSSIYLFRLPYTCLPDWYCPFYFIIIVILASGNEYKFTWKLSSLFASRRWASLVLNENNMPNALEYSDSFRFSLWGNFGCCMCLLCIADIRIVFKLCHRYNIKTTKTFNSSVYCSDLDLLCGKYYFGANFVFPSSLPPAHQWHIPNSDIATLCLKMA